MALDDRTRNSRVYIEALKRAQDYLNDPDKLDSLLNAARGKSKGKQGPLGKIWGQFSLLLDLMKHYRTGEYRDVSTKSVMMVIAAMLYFVIPADLIPDILLGFGFVDDVALLAWTINSLDGELEKFRIWRDEQKTIIGQARKEALRKRKGVTIEGELSE